jgi:uncharacterized protein
MNRLLLAAGLCLAFSMSCFAQGAADAPATRQDIEKYLEVAHAHDMMKQMMDAMLKPMHDMVHQQYEKEKDKLPPDFEAHMNKMMDEMMKQMPIDEMMDSMIPVYQKHLTKGDVDALTAFYSTPTGQKVLREMPAIMADAMQSMMPAMRKYIDGMQDRLQQEVAQMQKEGSAKAKPSSTIKN